MERRKLTKEDIDKVRHIEGFPIAKDEDIIALSDAPYYTACPNPFIESFIRENGSPYDEATDDYHREPFAADVSEGKHDPMYMAHSYHTKVPFRAITKYILNYTKPGDIVLDGFSGSGMTGVAAQMCGVNDYAMQQELFNEEHSTDWGERKAIIADLSPVASFIGYNFNTPFDMQRFSAAAENILFKLHKECDWMYQTEQEHSFLEGRIEYTVWSDFYLCPSCGNELCYWDISVGPQNQIIKNPKCPHCGADIDRDKCKRAVSFEMDEALGEIMQTTKSMPVKIFYSCGKKRYSKSPTAKDLEVIQAIKETKIPYWYPTDKLQEGYNTEQPKKSHGIFYVHQFYTKRNLYVLAKCFDLIEQEPDQRLKKILKFWFSSIYSRSHKLNRYMPNHNRHVGPLSGTLYIPYFQAEINIISLLEDKLNAIKNVFGMKYGNVIITNQSTTDLRNVPTDSIDYIFTDPPFGDNLNYSELNVIWESWLKCKTNNKQEAVINGVQGKGLVEYQTLMSQCFSEYFRVLKPNRWITVEFHNSKNAVWNAIQESLQRAGFVIADVRTLDKQKGTTKQLSNTSIVQQDLVISAYKPMTSLIREIERNPGDSESVWLFIKQHLDNLPVVVVKNNKIEIISERQAFLLFDRMVAYHIMNGLSVPVDAADFYRGLDERFLKRDGMYFLPNQVNEYDTARIVNEIEPVQLTFVVSNEKSAISWLYQQLDTPQTYAEIQPKFMQEVKTIDKFEAMPELAVLLEENFLQDEKGRWYIPDVTKEADVAKLREKNLLKEFEGYLATKGKLKLFRAEAIRVGFAKLWKEKNYKLIVETAERLPEQIIQEDDKLLMYYDISLGRV